MVTRTVRRLWPFSDVVGSGFCWYCRRCSGDRLIGQASQWLTASPPVADSHFM